MGKLVLFSLSLAVAVGLFARAARGEDQPVPTPEHRELGRCVYEGSDEDGGGGVWHFFRCETGAIVVVPDPANSKPKQPEFDPDEPEVKS